RTGLAPPPSKCQLGCRTVTSPLRRAGSPARRADSPMAWAFLAPSLAGITAFLVLPILVVLWLSLNRWDLLSPMRFVGLANWADVLTQPALGQSLLLTVAFVAMVIQPPTAP